MVTGGIRVREQQFGIGAAFLNAFHQRISRRDIQQSVWCVNGSRTSALGNRFGDQQSFHITFAFKLRDGPVIRYGVKPYRRLCCFMVGSSEAHQPERDQAN